jgi:hypothetical protein
LWERRRRLWESLGMLGIDTPTDGTNVSREEASLGFSNADMQQGGMGDGEKQQQ